MNKVYVLIGVSGVGKTTLGRLLAEKLSLAFHDADDFHSEANNEKLKAGIPLNDKDRESWLTSLSRSIEKWSESSGAVLACSALKEKHREELSKNIGDKIVWIYLYEDFETISERLKARKSHFFDPTLLRSQFDILEPPRYGIQIKVEDKPEVSLDKILNTLSKPRIGLIGLGVMGRSLALNIARNGFPVSVYNRKEGEKHQNIAKDFSSTHSDKYEIPAFDDLKSFISALDTPRNILNQEKADHLLLNPAIAEILNENKGFLKSITSRALDAGCPMPVSSAALNYFLNFVRGNTSANIIQTQRDYFGAHTYERSDKPHGEYFHTKWNSE
ncbi:gluconokinase, GntK/IdnK-type [Gramella lutea]|uniref:Gluconokinase n=1 Tax=Christiangramia lutea TaxID=1607951 RepID=A0A9X1V5A7_9FLAO|nr:gluconokinase, GntK/IdnK-type [Christiangramia lutea]MCH4823079.1 gluconokinase, GntK/IdnK-type [Christiangramia lutea]